MNLGDWDASLQADGGGEILFSQNWSNIVTQSSFLEFFNFFILR
jgi:hypothetical protein